MEFLKEHVGKRVLYRCKSKRFPFTWYLREGVVQEITPYGHYVKIDGKWYDDLEIELVEVLE